MDRAQNHSLKAIVIFLVLLIIHLQPARADAPLEAATLLKQYQLSEIAVSPDGQRVAVVITKPMEGDQRRSSIWLYERSNGVFRRLTTAGKIDSSPRWAPHGRTLAFLSEREDEKPQIFILPMSGGEGERLSDVSSEISTFEWSPDGNAIAYLAVEYGTEIADINAYDTWYLGTPYENLDDFNRMSPMTYVKNVRTPSLILVGEDDPIDPIAQCWRFSAA